MISEPESVSTVSTESPLTVRPQRRPLSLRRRILFGCLIALFVFGLFQFCSWLYLNYRLSGGVTFSTASESYWFPFYPELVKTGVIDAQLTPEDGYLDVLMLGGSVLEDVSGIFEERLRLHLKRPLRVHRLATAAHTTRDSYLKYNLLAEKHFDLIVIYHGINDVRMNCCPPAEFRDDYTHCHRYRSIKRRELDPDITIADVISDDLEFSIPVGPPDDEFLQFGDQIKTERAFRDHLEQIVSAARDKHQLVLLMTFALYLPENYSREKYEARELDYGAGTYQLPAELWGKPANVVRTVAAHNRVIQALLREHPELIAVDQMALMPADGKHFSDPCHFTESGCERFVENLIPQIVERLESARNSQRGVGNPIQPGE